MILKKINLNFLQLVLWFCIAGIFTLQNNHRNKIISQAETLDYFQEEQRLRSVLNLQKVVPDLGFSNLKADELFLSFIQYFGDRPAREQTGYTLTPEYFSAIIKSDPQFIAAYPTLINANTMYAGQPEQSINFIEEILDSTSTKPSDELHHLLWFYKAWDELLFLGDIPSAQYSYSQAKSIQQEQPNLQKNVTTKYFPNTEALEKSSDIIQAQILAWSTVLPHVKDIKTKQKISAKITSLRLELTQSQ